MLPSELLRAAVRDLTLCEKDENFEIDMWNWYTKLEKQGKEICRVCLAGAYLAKSLHCDFKIQYI